MLFRGSRFSLLSSASPAVLTFELAISGAPVLNAAQGIEYVGFAVQGFGGKPPYSYSVAAGALPAGIELDPETGEVAGTPTVQGAFAGIVIRVQDALGATASLAAFTLTVASPVDTTPDDFAFASVNNADPNGLYESDEITVTGINAATTLSVVGGWYRKNGGAPASAPTSVVANDKIRLRAQAHGDFGQSVTATVTIGSVEGAFRVVTAAAVLPTVFVSNRGRSPRTGATAAAAAATVRRTSRTRYYVGVGGAKFLRLLFCGYYTNTNVQETDLPNAYAIKAHVEIPAAPGTKLQVVTWGGAASGLVPSGSAEYACDDVAATAFGYDGAIPAGTILWVVTEREVAIGEVHLAGMASSSPAIAGEAAITGATSGTTPPTWVGVAGALASGGGWTGATDRFGPLAIVGTQDTAAPAVLGVGDSIMAVVDDNGGDGINNGTTPAGGFFIQGLANVGGAAVPLSNCNIASRGETAALFLADSKRKAMFKYATHVVSNYGTNEFAGATTAAQALANIGQLFTYAKSQGAAHCVQAGVIPRTTGAWTLADGSDQTYFNANGFDAKRVAFNADAAALTITDQDEYLDHFTGLITLGADAKKWLADGVAQKYTADGVHPTPLGHRTMASALAALAASW